MKLSGYITGQFVGGNLETQYNWGDSFTTRPTAPPPPISTGTYPANGYHTIVGGIGALPYETYAPGSFNPFTTVLFPALGRVFPVDQFGGFVNRDAIGQFNQRVLYRNADTFNRPETGWTTRANFGFDFASNTAYGPLIGHFDINSETGNGLDNVNGTYLNEGYVTWAGITAGKAASFYSFTGGGDNWANFASPDQKGYNQPNLMAYTASFGGGFSATIAAQSPGQNGYANFSGGGTDYGAPFYPQAGVNILTNNDITFGGQRWPDFVGNLHVKQGWGEAQVSGVIHDVNVRASSFSNTDPTAGDIQCGIPGITAPAGTFNVCNAEKTQTGWGIDAGVKVNLQNWWGGFWGAGDDILVTGSYTQSAVWYSGLPDMMWGENGQVNGNGQPMYMADAYFNPFTNQWSKPTAWSVSALLEHHFTPQFYLDLEGSVGGLEWSNMGGGCGFALGLAGCGIAQFVQGPLSKSATTWLIGADLGWNPVTNLNFDLELMYQDTNQQRPSGFVGTYDC